MNQKQARSAVTQVSNPVFNVDGNANDDEYLDVQDTLVLQAEQAETQFSDFDDDLDGSDLEL